MFYLSLDYFGVVSARGINFTRLARRICPTSSYISLPSLSNRFFFTCSRLLRVYDDLLMQNRESGEDFESAWHASLTLLEPLERSEWDNHQEEVREFYRECYRT